MIQLHFGEHWAENITPESDDLFFLSQVIGGQIPAPLFVLLFGMSYALWLRAQARAGRSADDIVRYSLRRGLAVLALAYLINVFIWLPDSRATFDWDILQLIGAAAIIIIPMRNWRPGVLIAICVVILLVSPPLRDLADYSYYWVDGEFVYHKQNLTEVLLAALVNGYFPLFPWLIFPLAGLVLGRMFYRNEHEDPVPRIVPLLGIVLIVAALLGVWIGYRFPADLQSWVTMYYATDWPEVFHPAKTVFVLGALGGFMLALWVLNRVIDHYSWFNKTGAVVAFFRRYSFYALSGYVAHLAFTLWLLWIIAWWEHKPETDYYLGEWGSMPTAIFSALIFIVVFYAYLVLLDRHKKWSLENFMRWVSG